ncbi:hypothetical protein F5X99DRAFT_425189 [Biscogniauxia marginata]|nr:hypothetical protein F5X99DRAFT_425189 [Biscogniauxia marginata]
MPRPIDTPSILQEPHVIFVFPVYFQAVLGGSPQDSGIWLLPTVVFSPFGAGSLISKTGRYRPIHTVEFALCTLAFGLCSILDQNSHKAGAAIPATIFNDRFGQLLHLINDEQVRANLADGQAYAKASSYITENLNDVIRDEVVRAYSMSLQRVWHIGIIFAGVSFPVVFLEKELVMRQDLKTDFGLQEEEKGKKQRMSELYEIVML